MRKFFILCLMAFVMCSCNLEQKRIAEERARFVADSIATRKLEIADSLAKAREREKFVADSIAKVEHINAVKNSIQLKTYSLDYANSVGGRDMFIRFYNISKKTIKYIRFECRYYNAVDDVVYCEIRNNSTFTGKVTGPIKYWEYYSATWDCPIYNWSAKKMDIIGITIDYMDGTHLRISKEEMKLVKGYNGKKSLDYSF